MIRSSLELLFGSLLLKLTKNGRSRFELNVTKAHFDTSGLSKFHLPFHIQLYHHRMHPDLIQMTVHSHDVVLYHDRPLS